MDLLSLYTHQLDSLYKFVYFLDPSGDEADVRSGSHQLEGSSNWEDGCVESLDLERNQRRVSQPPMAGHSNGEELKSSLIRCKSWPDPSNSPSPSMEQETRDPRFKLEGKDKNL